MTYTNDNTSVSLIGFDLLPFREYESYCKDLDAVENILLTEGIVDTLTGVPKKLMAFIKPIREYFPNVNIKDTIKAFKNIKVFGILKSFGFNLTKMIKAIHKGISLIDAGLLKVMQELGKTGTFQKIKKGIIKLDDVINEHPILNRVTGIGVAGILLVIWLNMSFAGNFDQDMDLSHMFKALAGDFSLEELFGTAVGAKMFALLSLGITTGGAVSFPWLLKTTANLSLAISYSIFKMVKNNDINIEEIKNRIKKKKLEEYGMQTTFKDFLNEEDQIQSLVKEMMFIMDTDSETLNEMMIAEDDALLEGKLKDFGKGLVHVSKGNRSLIKYFKSAGKGLGKMFIALMKGDVDTVKDIAKTVKSSDVLDFLLKLDAATLHLITGPIHSLEAITGWHIWANIQKAQKGSSKLVDKIKNAIKVIKQNIGSLIAGVKQKEYLKYLDTIENSVADPTSFTNLAMSGKRA
jgi:hypothetical protein